MKQIGLIGCGAWGAHILRDLESCGAVVHVADPSESARRHANTLGSKSIVEDVSQLPQCDGYIIAAPTLLHAGLIEALLDSGRPIFTEKPMTGDVASARRIADAGKDRVFVMQKWRYHPGIERMRQELASGRIGDILAIHLQRSGWGRSQRDINAIWTLMPHDLSIVLHWLGGIPRVRCALPTVPGSIDRRLIVQLGEQHGPTVTIDMSIVSPIYRRSFLIVGTKASMELCESGEPAITLRRGVLADELTTIERIPIARDMPLLLELKAFLAHLDGGPPPMTSACEGQLIVERTAEIEAAALAAVI